MKESVESIQRRGIAGILLLATAITMIVATALGYMIWYAVAIEGRAAAGPQVRMTFTACPEARPVVEARVGLMGLPEPEFADVDGGFTLVTRLPDAERVQEALPKTLAATGHLVLTGSDGTVVATEADLASAGITPIFLDMPRLEVTLTPEAAKRLVDAQMADPDGKTGVRLDDLDLGAIPNQPPLLDGVIALDRHGRPDVERLDFAASAAITLDEGPLPCPVTVDVARLEAP